MLVNVFKCFPVEEPERKPSIFLLIGSGMCIFSLSQTKEKSYEEEERKNDFIILYIYRAIWALRPFRAEINMREGFIITLNPSSLLKYKIK